MLIPSVPRKSFNEPTSLSRRVNANSQQTAGILLTHIKLIKKGEC